MNDTIPEFFDEGPSRKIMKSAKKPHIKKLTRHPSKVYSTAKDNPEKSGPNKSFNVRVISKKEGNSKPSIVSDKES